jgi:amidohydrolase
METSIKEKIAALEEKYRASYMESYYHFHKNPEPSYQEKETAAYVAEKLRSLPLENIRTNVGGYGLTAVLRGGKPGPVVALRADMDALNITEATGAAFASCRTGVMHACGHDAHTAILLGVVQVLCSLREQIPGAVKFVFQPSEEVTPHGGSQGMIKDGALEDPHVDSMIGLHVWPGLPTGVLAAQDGIMSAASDHLTVKVIGKAAHASMPNEGVDALLAASALVMALQGIISRNVSPNDAAVITIGTMQAGTRYNVIAQEALLDGTIRTFNPAVTELMPGWIRRTAEHTAAAYGARAEVEYQSGYPSVYNAPEVAKFCRAAVIETLGEAALMPPMTIPPIGEDFAFFAKAVPAAFVCLGCRPADVAKEDMPPLHNARFLPDPGALPVGVRYTALAALKLLAGLGKLM